MEQFQYRQPWRIIAFRRRNATLSRNGDHATSLDYGCHCRLPIKEAQRRIDFMRRSNPELIGGVVHVTDAGLGRFDAEIAREFGIEAKSKFSIHLLNNEWLDECREALEYTYRVFGTQDLVITYGNDSIRPPLRQYEPMDIG